MKVTLFVRESRTKSSKSSAQLPLIICFRNGKMNLWQTTRLSVNPDWWDQDHQQLKSRMAFNPEMRQSFNNEVADIRKYVSDAFLNSKMPQSPFKNYSIGTQNFGTPYYLTKDEMIKVLHFDFKSKVNDARQAAKLEKQRDVFIFQCSIGCRVSDLLRLTRQDIVNGALEYIKGLMSHLGYANQPYIIVEHNDIERRHFHVVSVRVDENVKGIPTHKEGSKIKEYSIANQERFGFIYGKDPLAEEKTLNIHSRFERGRGWIKDQIRRFASGILKSYSFSTQSQFSKIMRHYGIKAEWKRKEDTSILLCQGLDSQGNAVTRPVTLPQLQTESIMVACSKRPKDYEEKRKAALHRLKDAYYESTSVEELQNCLEENNVELLFDKTKDGTKIYGVTLIDYHTRSAFKGSELDKTLMNDIKAGIFKERPREVKPYDPFEETKQIINEFNSMAGESAIWNPKVFGLRLEGNKVSLTYEGRDYIWMELNKPNVSMSCNTPQWMMEMIDKCNNVFDIAKVFGPLVLSESNINRARNPQPTESEIHEKSLQNGKGPRLY